MTPIKRVILDGTAVYYEDWAAYCTLVAVCPSEEQANSLAVILMNYHQVPLLTNADAPIKLKLVP